MHIPGSEGQKRSYLVRAINNAWNLTRAADAIPTRLRAGTEPIHWPFPMLERLHELAEEMPGPDGLEAFQQAITEAYDDNRAGIDETPVELQQADLDGVSRFVEGYGEERKAKGKGKGRQEDGDSGDQDNGEDAQGMHCTSNMLSMIFTDSHRW